MLNPKDSIFIYPHLRGKHCSFCNNIIPHYASDSTTEIVLHPSVYSKHEFECARQPLPLNMITHTWASTGNKMPLLLPFCRNAHFACRHIFAQTPLWHIYVHSAHTHTLSCLSSYLQLLPLHSAHTHSPPQQLQLILVPVAGIKAVTYRPVNLHTLPVMPLHFSHNAAEIL